VSSVPSFDLADPAVRNNPYPYYRRLQESQPVARTPRGAWLLTRYQDVYDVVRDPRFSSDPANLNRRARRLRPDRGSLMRQDGTSTILVFQDPPDHTRVRSLVNQAFTPRRVEKLESQVHAVVTDLLDRIEERGGPFDVLGDFGFPLPVHVICDLVGVPFADQEQFREWSPPMARMLDGNLEFDVMVEGMAASAKLIQYFNALYEARRDDPQDDLLTAIVAAEHEGDRLSASELRLITTLLFVAGFETTLNLIGNGTLALLRHPDELERLRADPSLARNAVEELLRYDSPVHVTVRIPTERVEVAGQPIPPGESVICALGAANRDPEVFPDPDRLDITRPNAKSHLAFSGGHHYCMGAALARSEAEVAFSQLVQRFPQMKLLTEQPEFRETQVIRGLRELLVQP
jgi:cytochrome P450